MSMSRADRREVRRHAVVVRGDICRCVVASVSIAVPYFAKWPPQMLLITHRGGLVDECLERSDQPTSGATERPLRAVSFVRCKGGASDIGRFAANGFPAAIRLRADSF
jgi:hypothetical protein